MTVGPSDPSDDADDEAHEHDALVAAGLYDPAAADAAARLALLDYLLGLGLSIPELVQASIEQRILSVAALNRITMAGTYRGRRSCLRRARI